MNTSKHILCLLRSFGDPSTILRSTRSRGIPRRTLILVYLVVSVFAVQAQNGDEAKRVLRLSREKCQSILQGHYVLEHRNKTMMDRDTTIIRYTCDFKKLPTDTLFNKAFNMFTEFPGHEEWNDHTLYTGNELVIYNDTAGEIMVCELWADKIKHIRHNFTFYEALTNKNCYPIPDEKLMSNSAYTFTLMETPSCYKVDYIKTEPEPAGPGMQCIRYEVEMWLDKNSHLPVQYTIAYDLVEGQDTMCQYDLFKLLAFDAEIDESRLTIESIPATVTLSDYVPNEEPEPLAEGTMAPDWSLPTLTGDTVRLADLRGKVVLIDFFYKSCAPCCAALPFLQSLHEKYKDNGFVMIGIDPYDDPVKGEMSAFLAKRGVTYTVLFSDRELPKTYHVSGYPTLIFLNREGNIVKTQYGFSTALEETLEEQLKKMLQNR